MKKDTVYLRHILDAATKIESYVTVGKEEFMSLSHWHDAVIRQLEILGEAAKGLSGDLRTANSDIPWRRICGLRDVLIHNYMGVDLEAVWQITQTDVPRLKTRVVQLLADG